MITIVCPNCNCTVPSESRFCPYCGAVVIPQPQNQAAQSVSSKQTDPRIYNQTPANRQFPQGPQQSCPPGASGQFQPPIQPVYSGFPGNPVPALRSDTNSEKWFLVIPVLLLIALLLRVLHEILLFKLISDAHIDLYWYQYLSEIGPVVFLLCCVAVFFARTRRKPMLSAVFHGMMLLIPLGFCVYSLTQGSRLLWDGYVYYGSFLTMVVLYFVAAGIGKRCIPIAIIYTLFSLAIVALSVRNVIDYLDNYYWGASVEDYLYLFSNPAALLLERIAFPVALFSFPDRNR